MEKQAEADVIRAQLLAKAREASTSPGVYQMKDEAGAILYVGKAKNLKNRLSTYFQAGPHEASRTELLVHRVKDFEVILTETESEALILENTLIKKHKPRFNIRLKDDKTYPYLKIRVADNFPRIEWTRRVERDGARYFGPFPSAWSARQVMNLLNETYLLRDCSENTFRHRTRPCILHQIGRCSGPCVGLVDRAGYHESLAQVVAVLEGRTERLVAELRRGMDEAAEREEYEAAASYRDQIRNLELVTQTQAVVDPGEEGDRDVVGIARGGPREGAEGASAATAGAPNGGASSTDAHGVVLQIRAGKLVAVRHFHVQNADPAIPEPRLLSDFVTQYYLEKAGNKNQPTDPEAPPPEAGEGASPGAAVSAPREILLPIAPEEPELLERAFGVRVIAGESPRERQLLQVARSNAEYALEQSRKRGGGHGARALEEVQDKLHLDKLPHRIECYDISNTQGEDAVASRVVFIDGAPDKNLYRRYKIRTVQGANDFAMMKEVLARRFAHSVAGAEAPEELPDLVVVDGGKGQLAQAVAILGELAVQGVDVVGLAKARTERDFQASEVKSSRERIFIPNRKNPVPLLPHTDAYKLLTHVRDEAHRFAIGYHRLLRGKRSLRTGEAE